MAEAVKVIVRCRPLNGREKNLSCSVVVKMDSSIGQCIISKPNTAGKDGQKAFTFDGVYFVDSTTEGIYPEVTFPLVDSVVDGFNGTVFAYGQTGCGKSYTMMGVSDPPTQLGIIPRTFEHIFNRAATNTDVKYLIHASYLEIYNEEVRDLLAKDVKRKMDLKEHPSKGVYVQGLSKHRVSNIPSLEKVLELGGKNRSVGETLMNVDSSRSHSIFTIEIESSQVMENGKDNIRMGKLNLVDLAGSERQSKTGSTGDRLKEATKINLSLSALGNVISALVDGRSKHIPYRDSKLTRLLQSSLGGNTKTLMVACISPADNNYDETLSTLRYANRAKNIKNKPKINEDPKDALLREYREEIERLKGMLDGNPNAVLPQNGVVPGVATAQSESSVDLEAEKAAIREKYEKEIAGLKTSFSSEQQTSQTLLQQLQQLQSQYQQSLDALAVQPAPQSASVQLAGGPSVTGDQAAVMSQLQELQGALVGGEAAANVQLKQELDEKKKLAEEHEMKVQQASEAIFFDDEILVKIYNSLTEEVSAKHSFAVHERDRRKAAEEDIKDLQIEFQEEREEYLATIRRQQQKIQLQEQLLATVVPCLRRDCNYYNIDKVRSECRWDEEEEEWTLPKLTVTRTELKSLNSSVSTSAVQMTTASPRGSPRRTGNSIQSKRSADNAVSLIEEEYQEDNKQGLAFLSQPAESSSNYFKPKRAEVLLSGNHQSGVGRTNGLSESLSPNKSTGRLQPLKKCSDPLAIVEQAERRIGHNRLQPIYKPPP